MRCSILLLSIPTYLLLTTEPELLPREEVEPELLPTKEVSSDEFFESFKNGEITCLIVITRPSMITIEAWTKMGKESCQEKTIKSRKTIKNI